MKKPNADGSTEDDQLDTLPEYKNVDPYTPPDVQTPTLGEAPNPVQPPPQYSQPGMSQSSFLAPPVGSQSVSAADTAPPPSSGSTSGASGIDQIIAEYQKQFGRAPDQNELTTDAANLAKYGWNSGPNGGVQATIDSRASNTPNQTPGGSSTPTQLRAVAQPPSSSTAGSAATYTPPGSVQTNGVASNDPFGTLIGDKLSELIANNGQVNSDQVALQREKATEDMNTSRRTQLNQAQGELADRNLLSVPGIPQGSELGAMGRIEQNIAPAYAQANRDITIADDKQANDTLLSVLNMGNERQGMLGQIAIQTLAQNTQWNEFLATYGLQRDQVMYQLQNGQINDIEGLMQLFEQFAQMSAGGHV